MSREVEWPETDFMMVCEILWLFAQTEMWDKPEHIAFIEHHDIGLPLAYSVHEGHCVPNDSGIDIINQTWYNLIEDFELEDDYKDVQDFLMDMGFEWTWWTPDSLGT